MAGTNRIQLGSAVVTRVVEWQFEVRSSLFDQTPASGWQDNADLLVPTFFNPDIDRWRVAIQSWVIEVDGLTVVVDTGAGNDRQRPHMPPLDHLDTGFLDDVRAAGFDYNDVDVVINTHIHSDHLGWNTKLENGTWVPTFPNARYLMPAPDYRFFHPDGPAAKSVPRTEHEQKRLDGTRLWSRTASFPLKPPARSSSGHRIIGSAIRRGCLRPRGTHPAPRCCGWTRARRQCSSGTLPTAPFSSVDPRTPVRST